MLVFASAATLVALDRCQIARERDDVVGRGNYCGERRPEALQPRHGVTTSSPSDDRRVTIGVGSRAPSCVLLTVAFGAGGPRLVFGSRRCGAPWALAPSEGSSMLRRQLPVITAPYHGRSSARWSVGYVTMRRLLWTAAALVGAVRAENPERRLQQQPDAQEPAVICAQLAESGRLRCASDAERVLCPQACAASAGAPPPPTTCVHLAERGTLQCRSDADLCPDECAVAADGGGGSSTGAPAGFRWSCPVLLRLEAGCAHDLSLDDPSIAPNTKVSDVCPTECAGRGGCAPTALDASFLGVTDDGSGHNHELTLAGDACADDGGVRCSGEGHVDAALDGSYAEGGDFSVAFWLLKAPADVWEPAGGHSELLFDHPVDSSSGSGHSGIEMRLTRPAWLDAWVLRVELDRFVYEYTLNILRDAVPMWTHVAVVVDDTRVAVYENGERIPLAVSAAQQWTCVFRQTAPNWRDPPDWVHYNADGDRSTEDFSILDEFETFRQADGKFTLKILWPRRDGINSNTWRQTSNPLTFTPGEIEGYEPIEIHFTAAGWGGLTNNFDNPQACCAPSSLLDGTPGNANYWYAIGVSQAGAFGGGTTMPEAGVEETRTEVWAQTALSPSSGRNAGFLAAASILARSAYIGGSSISGIPGLRGTLAMMQIYDSALSPGGIQCVYEEGRQLVHGGRMENAVPTPCRATVSTGCTSPNADDALAPGDSSVPAIDDGSCTFEPRPAGAGERGFVHVTDSWQSVALRHSYTRPVVICGIVTRMSTTAAVVRVRSLQMDDSGTWHFEIRAEQKSCHFATPPPTSERVSFLVVEVGVSAEGWQAGIARVHDQEWHRVSFAPCPDTQSEHTNETHPVVISQVQTFDNRTEFLSSRHHHEPGAAQRLGFFLQVTGQGIWCQDGEFFAEYFDSLDLSGNPIATQCEVDVPNWHWHSLTPPGIPPAMRNGQARTLDPELFSARWTARLDIAESAEYLLSSHANRGSRILVDGTTVLDYWDKCCSTFTSEPVPLSAGYHVIAYEYRSGYNVDFSPANSYAELSWKVGAETFGNAVGSNSSNVTSTADELYADVGWVACTAQTVVVTGARFQSGIVATDADLVTNVQFASTFGEAPLLFGSIVSTRDLSAHLRLSATSIFEAMVATEYDTCGAVFGSGLAVVGWVAIAAPDGLAALVNQRATLQTDVGALRGVATALRLPAYFHWRNSSDPCRDRWTGIECRTDAADTPRIVVLDIHDVDLTNQNIPWEPIGQLTELEELSLRNCGLTGVIDAAALCGLTRLQVLALRKNQLH
eukprot:COSAG04_NODE_2527_length_3972_cov_3.396463_1_plen_1287_part_10